VGVVVDEDLARVVSDADLRPETKHPNWLIIYC
jgi:hypothetical protein